MGINWSVIAAAGGIPKGPSRYTDKAAKQREKAAHWREVCRQVNERDDYCDRVTGAFINPHALGMLKRGHHHHLIPRSQGGPDETWNVVLLSPQTHQDEHHGKIRLSGNADERDHEGRLCGVKVERMGEHGYEVIAWT